MHNRNFYQILFCIFNSFCNGFLYFFCFTQTLTYNTSFITNYHQGRKTKCTSTLVVFTTRLIETTFSFNSRSPAFTLFKITFDILIMLLVIIYIRKI